MRGCLPPRPIFTLFATTLLLASCNRALEERVDRLEAELRGVRSDTRESVEKISSRVSAAEAKVEPTAGGKSLTDRIQTLEDSFSDVLAMKSRIGEMVYLRANLQGHAPLLTDHGTFLVRIEGIDLDLTSEGYTVHLNFGNPQAITIQQFTLRGDFGGATPELPEGEEYSLRNEKIQAWEKTLKPFEAHLNKPLESFSWTPISIKIKADHREDIEMIRFQMLIENAQLASTPASGGGGEAQAGSTFTHVNVDSKSASILKTEYGAFLISVKSAEQSDVGTKLHVEIGNPYGFTINQCRILGDYGQAIPKRTESTGEDDYNDKMAQWSASLQPFDSMISTKISNFRWSQATILIPAPVAEVKFLRCRLRVEDVSLPAATIDGKPALRPLGK